MKTSFLALALAVTRPPHLVCQYMTDTGLSLYHEGYRLGGAPVERALQLRFVKLVYFEVNHSTGR